MTAPVPLPSSLGELVAGARWTRHEGGESGGIVHRLTFGDGCGLVLKYGADRVADDVVAEAVRLRWATGRLPVAPLRWFACGSGEAWLLTEALPGPTGDEWLAREPGRWPAMVRGLARFMRRLHASPVSDGPFDAGHEVRLAAARRNVADGLVDEEDFDAERLGRTAAEVLGEAEALAPTTPERAVTHGDFSLGNIVLDESGAVTGCIDIGRLGVADPYQDLAVLWNNLGDVGEDARRLLLDELDLDEPDERRLRFHLLLDELF